MVLSKVPSDLSPFVIRDVLHRALQTVCSDLYARAKRRTSPLHWAGTTPRVTLATQAGQKGGRSSPVRCFARVQILRRAPRNLQLFTTFASPLR